ncbi:hypothetical protein X767_32640 [Mesorhizobium sp. LSJC264A00]|nr:hypothetical protein X767_32640 [Mesorhizobium sp. LSJC264A00]
MSSGQDIATSIKGRLWNTLFLAFWAAIVAVPLAIILGLIAVRYRNGWVDKLISGPALASTSVPEFFIGYVRSPAWSIAAVGSHLTMRIGYEAFQRVGARSVI